MQQETYFSEHITEDKFFKNSIIDKRWTLAILKKLEKPINKIITQLNTELIQDIKLKDSKLKQQYTIADAILEGRDTTDNKVIVHIEIQKAKDKAMRERMENYAKGIRKAYPGIPIYQIFIYTGKTKLKSKERLNDFVDLSTLEFRKDFTAKEMMESFKETSGRPLAIYCATNEEEFKYLEETFLEELYKKYDNKLVREDSYVYFYQLLCILYLEEKTSKGIRKELVCAFRKNIESKFKKYSNITDTNEIVMKGIKNPYMEPIKRILKEEGRKEGRKEGIQFGSLNLLSKMIRNKQLDREQSEEYLRDLGMDKEAITKFLKGIL